YRRFFNINELITLRTEDEEVFNQTHSLLFRMIRNSGVTGVRIDHIDGAYDPLRYLRRLREKAGDVYLVVEKILGHDEELPAAWPVEGTTGYDFLNALNGVFCDTAKEAYFSKLYAAFTGQRTPYPEMLYSRKKLITEMDMMSDVSNIVRLLKITLSRDRYGSDITMPGLKRAMVEVMSFFPVYRTYISDESFTGADRARIDRAVTKAINRNPALLNELEFIRRVLSLNYRDYHTDEEKKEWLHFAMRFQQFTGPLMAKGFEDTLLYVYNRLLSLNEVGGDPGRFGVSAAAFHSVNAERAKKSPHSMNATSTHDTKRGEDVRARINALSEIPREWEEKIKRWAGLNRKKKRSINGVPAPSRNDEYFLYQTLVGAMPFDREEYPSFIERMKRYAVKAVREAKIHTAWLKPDADYEDAFASFVSGIMEDKPENRFLADFIPFQKRIAWMGVFNSLSQVLMKAASPGVPDFYQGAELWDLNLVDPDNRRPVDFAKRKEFLRDVAVLASKDRLSLARELLQNPADGRIKLFVTHEALKARKENADLFYKGSYIPIEFKGEMNRHILAFARQSGRSTAIAIAPRFFTPLIKEGEYPVGTVWADTEMMLPDALRGEPFVDAFTGEPLPSGRKGLPIADALKAFPVSLLLTGS
ncbi:MAG: malto-oligosyltrehalose synthase, partial [Deltaproteobacteria bacterium]|nr:malto-oligosyltrehalose synthase [Deltaproteobacteria bacterium]